MSVFGSGPVSGVQSAIPGGAQAERAAARDSDRTKATERARPVRRGQDQVELDVDSTETVDAVRGLAGNDQEETSEDRREHEHYAPTEQRGEEPPSLDVQA